MTDEPASPPLSEQPTLDRAAGPRGSFGRYSLLQRIGEGGMGEVWLAEQTAPLHRRVALKVIKAGMDSAQVVARFEAERQALALMDHPVIATVFDGGTTPEGRPYFAMEYVRGEPITAYCDRHRLGTNQRLELVMQICEGVQHAHQKGIIHRDLKPSNVLVTIQGDRPVPKIIDFGVAKATSQQLTERSLFTELGVLIGTPEYMSPEQAEMGGLDIDTRTDVYALGVLLYELLTGALPFDRKELRQAGLAEIQRIIREKEPPRPSTRITQRGPASREAASNRDTDPRRLASELHGDLDWITMRALEKDRTRRYGSAKELAADLARHLGHEPVTAGPPSTAYRAAKFVRRHRLGVAVAAITALLVPGLALREKIQADRIAREAAATERVSAFLVDLFDVSNPSEARGNSITAREILDRGAARIEKQLAGEPLVQARLMATMGRVYSKLGLNEQARPLLEQALARRRELLGESAPQTLASMEALGQLSRHQGRYAEAERLLSQVVDARRRRLGEDDASTLESLNSLANVYTYEGRYDDAGRLYRQVLETRRRTLGENHPDTALSMHDLALLDWRLGRYDQAESLLREAIEVRRRVLGEDHPLTLSSMGLLAEVYVDQNRLDEAEELLRRTLDLKRRVLGKDHPDTLKTLVALGRLYERQRRFTEAEHVDLELLETERRVRGKDHPDTLLTMNNLAMLYEREHRYDEARKLLQGAIAMAQARGKELEVYPVLVHSLGELFLATGNLAEAERQIHHALDLYEARGGSNYIGLALQELAEIAARQHRPQQALDLLRQALEKGVAVKTIEKDSSFDSLRGDPEYQAIVSTPKTGRGGA